MLQLLGMAGGHWFSPCPQPVLGGHLQAELRKLATANGPKELENKRAKERN